MNKFALFASYLSAPKKLFHSGLVNLQLKPPGNLAFGGTTVAKRLKDWPRILQRLLYSSSYIKIWSIRTKHRTANDYKALQLAKQQLDMIWAVLSSQLAHSSKPPERNSTVQRKNWLVDRVASQFVCLCAQRRAVILARVVERQCLALDYIDRHALQLSMLYLFGIVGESAELNARLLNSSLDLINIDRQLKSVGGASAVSRAWDTQNFHMNSAELDAEDCKNNITRQAELQLAGFCGILEYLKVSSAYDWQFGSKRKRAHLQNALTIAKLLLDKVSLFLERNPEACEGRPFGGFFEIYFDCIVHLPRGDRTLKQCILHVLSEFKNLNQVNLM